MQANRHGPQAEPCTVGTMSSSPRPTTAAPASSVTDHQSAAASSRGPPSPSSPNERWDPHQVNSSFELPAAMYLPASYKDSEPMAMAESSGEDHEPRAPKRRAETWAQEEARCLVALRRAVDGFFNISKSNRHLWCRISAGMREKGFERSPTMCTDKWRNLLKEFKKARQRSSGGGAKVCCYKEIEDLLRERCKNVDAFGYFSDRASGRSALNSEGCVDHDGHSLAIAAADTVATGEAPSWNWRDTTGNGGDSQSSYGGRVIHVKWGEYTRKIGIDGTTDAIKDVIKSAFGLRTKRAFWLEDEDEVIRSPDRRMPLGTYTLHLDEGLGIKICFYAESDRIPVQTEAKTLYTEDDFHDFLARRGWTHLRQLDDGFKCVDSFDELHEGGIYQGVRFFGDV